MSISIRRRRLGRWLLGGASVLIGSALAAASAQAQEETLAGWDFSQYFSDGLLTTDGVTTTTTLPANYSALDPTFNAGSESAAYGTATLGAGVVPTAGSLESNRNGPVKGFGQNGFESRNILKSEGQPFQERMSLTSAGTSTIEFEADASSISGATDWSISFAGKSRSGVGTVDVEYSPVWPDGDSFTSFGSVNLDTDDTAFEVALGAPWAEKGKVRLTLNPGAGQLILDNVAVDVIPVPEPGVPIGLAAGFAGLLLLRRFRS